MLLLIIFLLLFKNTPKFSQAQEHTTQSTCSLQLRHFDILSLIWVLLYAADRYIELCVTIRFYKISIFASMCDFAAFLLLSDIMRPLCRFSRTVMLVSQMAPVTCSDIISRCFSTVGMDSSL